VSARSPAAMIRHPAMTKIRLTALSGTPAGEARKVRRTVLASHPHRTIQTAETSWLTGPKTASTRPRNSRGAASRSIGIVAVFSTEMVAA
jgi:hypothetical protein